ncbi:uncharacterized protein TOT_030000749 [Theileria orientalis strain Shintoku]|uniref:Uncharacterized protein n=1 Tax=Theileria orientalis strain Shintoku TaxID=869250 RepID=J4CDP2_THEOR|nr:uncharacterized protein TOT_030000749 [Theileria orientalis strain Shintoku]BAM41487.1 uncharacterized protein TOT_030000749 [Theileria orientalis strain Shintoku]|eukprot:XP_009691788.1 uncharacterized protein TOT_030000749 [Theileria orientalis strain Shintoku]
MDLCISILLFTILSIQNEINFASCREFTILDRRNTHIDITHHRLVTVDIKNCSTNSRVSCDYDPTNDSSTFTPNQGYFINKVTKREAVLWDAKDYGNQYGSQVFVGKGEMGNRVFRVYFPSPLQTRQFEPPKPIQPETTKPKLVTLDIKNKKSTEEIDYEYDEKHRTHTFTPNKGYLIHDVTRKGKVMWECEKGVYPEMVLILPNEEGEPVLRFKFPKIEDTPDETFETDHRLVDLNVAGNEPSHVYEIIIDYNIDISSVGYLYIAKSVFKFKSVGEGSHLVWKAKNESECAKSVLYIRSLIGINSKVEILFFDGTVKFFYQAPSSIMGNPWRENPYDFKDRKLEERRLELWSRYYDDPTLSRT